MNEKTKQFSLAWENMTEMEKWMWAWAADKLRVNGHVDPSGFYGGYNAALTDLMAEIERE